jgi:dipeptidyl aminopeptidase/acylaminoacyl peptidase
LQSQYTYSAIPAEAQFGIYRHDCAAPLPIWEFAPALRANRIPPLLLFHGEADKLLPVSQAEGMRRALASASYPGTVITYPGQGHFFQSRECIKDTPRRMVYFVTGPLHIQVDHLAL